MEAQDLRPLRECFLLAQYEGAGSLPADELPPGGPNAEGTRRVRIGAVRPIAPFLTEWLGDVAVHVKESEGTAPSELYGSAGLAIHLIGDQYRSWPAARDLLLQRLETATGHPRAFPGTTRLGVVYIDAWTASTSGELLAAISWPVDPSLGQPVGQSVTARRIAADGLVVWQRVERVVVDEASEPPDPALASASPSPFAARVVFSVEAGREVPSDLLLNDRESATAVLDGLHASSKMMLWFTMLSPAREQSGLFDDEEIASYHANAEQRSSKREEGTHD